MKRRRMSDEENNSNMSCNEDEEGDEAVEEEEEPEVPEKILKAMPLTWPKDRPSLIRGGENLRESKDLDLPAASEGYLASFFTHEKFDMNSVEWQNGCIFPGVVGGIHKARVVGAVELTQPDAEKPKREIQIDLGSAGDQLDFEPGDAFYFIVPNPREEVNFIMQRMNLLTLSDQIFKITVDPKTTKQNASAPPYIPLASSLRYIFTYCLDIRRAPEKPLLRVLADGTKDEGEKRRILELCSAQGVDEFTAFVQQAGISLADFLFAFPSCRPPAERVIELLPRLQPRAYSIAGSPLRWQRRIRFIYSLMHFPVADGRHYPRHGLASDYLASLNIGDEVQVMLKEPTRFRLPPPQANATDPRRIPLIMVGTGIGLAPFLSFLQHILEKNIKSGENVQVDRELYFGCRQLNVDCIYRDEVEAFLREKVLSHLMICESEPGSESDRPKYVQDALEKRGKKITDLLMAEPLEGREAARVYVCGDAKDMSKDVWAAFVKIISENSGKSENEAELFLEQLRKDDRYVENVWA